MAQNTISGVAISQIEYDGDTIYLATSGVGEIKAALAVQLLVDLFDIEAVLNFGFVGALNKISNFASLSCQDVWCIINSTSPALTRTEWSDSTAE